MRKLSAIFLSIIFVLFSLGANAEELKKPEEIKVYAAASLTDVLSELATRYQQTHKNITIKTVYAASSTLAKQIENGAPADLFISADLDWLDYLEKRNFISPNSRKNLLGNELVLITPAGKEFSVTFANNFAIANAFTGKLCTGEPAYVPVGKYAQQALIFYGWWDILKTRVVGTEDVRTALAFIERGECSLGIVYSTDAKISKKVSIIGTFPAASHKAIVYPGALLKHAKDDKKSDAINQEFWQYLQSNEARDIFISYGFSVLN